MALSDIACAFGRCRTARFQLLDRQFGYSRIGPVIEPEQHRDASNVSG